MNAAATSRRPPPIAYRRQTPTVWQAIGHAIWQAMEEAGQRRAARELRSLARRWDPIDPAVAQQLRDGADHDTRSIKETS